MASSTNILTPVVRQLLSMALMPLRESIRMARTVNSEYSNDAAREGDTIKIPVGNAVGTQAVTPSLTPTAGTALTPTTIDLPLDQWRKSNPFIVDDKEQREIMKRDVLPPAIRNAVKALVNEQNTHIMEKAYKRTYNFIGTPGTTPFADSSGKAVEAAAANRLIDIGLGDPMERYGVIDPFAKENMSLLANFAQSEQAGNSDVPIRGMLGERYGVQWLMDQTVLLHTAGTITTGLIAKASTAQEVGDTTIICTTAASTGACALKEGDIVTFDGHTQTYCLTADATQASAATDVTLNITPGLTTALSGSEAVAVKASHRVNLVYTRDAIGFAQAPNLDSESENSTIEQITDEISGASLRLETARQNKQRGWEFDMLYGAAPIYPEQIVRIAG